MQKPKILLYSNTRSTFVSRDINLLQRDFNVAEFIAPQDKTGAGFILGFLRSFVFLLRNISSTKFIFCWFADYHSFLPALFSKIFRRPFYLVEGGYDTVYLAEYDYGVFTTKFRSFCAKYAMRKATLNLPVSNFLKSELAGLGITHTEVIPTGYDPDRFKIANKKAKVISIAQVDSAKRFKIKGVDRVLAVASLIPEISIEIIGVSPELYNAAELPDNVAVLPNLTETEIAQKLAEAKVCLVLSVREGLPNIVFEAFLSGCVVVGIDHSGLAEAVGKYGYLIPEWDAQKAAGLVREAMHENDLGLKARDYVRNNFTQDHRYSKLQEVFNIVE